MAATRMADINIWPEPRKLHDEVKVSYVFLWKIQQLKRVNLGLIAAAEFQIVNP